MRHTLRLALTNPPGRNALVNLAARPDVIAPAILVSYAYSLEPFVKVKDKSKYRDVMLDSGAFSAWKSGKVIEIGKYIEDCFKIKQRHPDIKEIIALDVIGDAKASMRNAIRMKEAGMPGDRFIEARVIANADEIKWPVGKKADVEALIFFLASFNVPSNRLIYLQPLSQSESATKVCVDAAIEYGWAVSFQVHKYQGLR